MKKNILFAAILSAVALAAILTFALNTAPKSEETKNPLKPDRAASIPENNQTPPSSSLPAAIGQTQFFSNPNSQNLTDTQNTASPSPNQTETGAGAISENPAAAPPNNVSAAPQTTARQTSLMGIVISVDSDKFTMLSDGRIIAVVLDPNAPMYIRKSAARIAAQVPQSNIQPGHQIRVVTNDEIAGTTIKPLIVEDFSLPALGN